MAVHRRTWFDARGLVIAPEARLPVYSGALHYWRVDPSAWAPALAALRALGLTTVESYVPWRVHEPAPGQARWSGAADLGHFLSLARDAGLAVMLRPGPAVNAELTSFGFPDHVLADPAVQARTAQGTPVWLPSPPRAWPVPSYASRAFQAHVKRWYAALAAVVEPHLAPAGPVVAIGVDNEAQRFFRGGAFDHDYHPDALTQWHAESGDAPAPRAWDASDAARGVAWVRFGERALARALGAFADLLDEVGFGGIAKFHNLSSGHLVGCNVHAISEAIAGPVGLDAYTRRPAFGALGRSAAAVVGMTPSAPIAFEVGIGYAPWFPMLSTGTDTTRERDQLLRLLAGGIRGFNLFMAVERERFYGAAISDTGEREAHASWIPTLVNALEAVDWTALRTATPVALVATRADARWGLATSVLDPITPLVGDALGLGAGGAAELGTDAGAVLARRWHAAVASALKLARVPYAIVDEDAPVEALARYRAVIAPTLARVDRGLWQRLAALPATTTVVIGPDQPTTDELGAPLDSPGPRRVGRLQAGSVEDLPGLAADLEGLAGDSLPAWRLDPAPPTVRLATFATADAQVRVAFVINDGPAAAVTALLVEAGVFTLRDPFAADPLLVERGRVRVPVDAFSVRMLVVAR